ncbi:sulfurtransferase [Leeuwenhoekiella marinoflava]|uniref:Thiosulfate/3-mercaptopyruvate sulfurtransferase n=2 Tax=Leeuwenhoekiella marinoflava TaxID=988 RepID=A0A4Q0PNC6_9FLAO|nr:sulfurtransferase [Leeuwenhoekiella marinoflava]RXG31914.1 thiosulfate/3-mercaptopyruvate sulfurtransferase [Leeuwenhoekiella marinoflava]SHE91441.1 thiosulfate/3-mercaptopyruvate sulfurtransferase [Leeuwenhoekiella marinoflava DSM 3653]
MEVKEIVSAAWLHAHLDDENLIILDASLAQTATGKSAAGSSETIPNARYFDLKQVFSDASSAFPNTLPVPAVFEEEVRKLGIDADSMLVIFDAMGVYSSPRVWWLFQCMGHQNSAVLDGGLPEWKQQGFAVASEHIKHWEVGDFKAKYNPELLATYEEVLANTLDKSFTVVDARSAGRFNGTTPEPRKHLKSGSIPNSINIPYETVLVDGKFKSKEVLQELFKQTTDTENLVFSCGSGLTACIVMLAAIRAGKSSKRVYDGSWTEWAELQNLTLKAG